ncbi:MAG: CcmD family protein [Chlorobi bacterium]|nr:CcmD family protein [Chlorobiota bacterium]
MIEYLDAHPHVIVMIVTLLIWTGIAVYLWRLDKRLVTLENSTTTTQNQGSSSNPNDISSSAP